MGRILAIDYGAKRTGLAVTDPLRIIAGALDTVPTAALLDYVKRYVVAEGVDLIVVGMPRQMSGAPSASYSQIRPLVERLRKELPGMRVELFDERFTSVLAQRAIIEGGVPKGRRRHDKGLVDRVSATIILPGVHGVGRKAPGGRPGIRKRVKRRYATMFLPIYIYGSPVLRNESVDITKDYPDLDRFLADLWETMYEADGVGLAAPQVGRNIRVFVVDASVNADEDPRLAGFRKTFINARIYERSGEEVLYGEGCLSLPRLNEDVSRPERIRIRYVDEHFVEHDEEYDGFAARVIQHEYDHLDGKLFVDRLSPLRKTLIKGKLAAMAKGKYKAAYKTKLVRK